MNKTILIVVFLVFHFPAGNEKIRDYLGGRWYCLIGSPTAGDETLTNGYGPAPCSDEGLVLIRIKPDGQFGLNAKGGFDQHHRNDVICGNTSSAKKIIVHGPDLSSIPSQFPIHEIGFVMYYVSLRALCEGSQEAIGMALSLVWLVVPSVHGLYFKDMKQTLKKEQCDAALMVTANVPSAKKIIVHGLDLSSIPSQFPIHEELLATKINHVEHEAKLSEQMQQRLREIDDHRGNRIARSQGNTLNLDVVIWYLRFIAVVVVINFLFDIVGRLPEENQEAPVGQDQGLEPAPAGQDQGLEPAPADQDQEGLQPVHRRMLNPLSEFQKRHLQLEFQVNDVLNETRKIGLAEYFRATQGQVKHYWQELRDQRRLNQNQ